MVDTVDAATRSRMMAGIRSGNTKPELVLRKGLHARGFRFRLHRRDLPGRPDLVLPRYRACLFVHGCFWHRHPDCRFATTPATRTDFWLAKFALNVQRDRKSISALRNLDWRVGVVWECALRPAKSDRAIALITEWLHSDQMLLEIG
jgi:DNA mismatch endonuclease, patch repair protein